MLLATSRLSTKVAFWRLDRVTEVIGLSDLTMLLLTWGVYLAKRSKKHSMFSKTCNTD
jgi:hypothetical protein